MLIYSFILLLKPKTCFMKTIYFFIFLLISCVIYAQNFEPIYDESEIPEYKLPEILQNKKGKKIKSVKDWETDRRAEIIALFNENIYGYIPGDINITEVKKIEFAENAISGKAIRQQISLVFVKGEKLVEIDLLIYLPKNNTKAPVFLCYNFSGNHTVIDDVNVRISESWVPNNPSVGIINNQLTEQSRGIAKKDWPIEQIIDSGYGVVTAYYGDIDPDKNDFSDGIHPFLYSDDQDKPYLNEWGSIAAWSWGLSRIMDYLVTDNLVNESKVILAGHSRLGKAALWAGANDKRFSIVISNESGCGGAALSRRRFGESVAIINQKFPHWFCDNFLQFNNDEDRLPVDQHMLLALVAPRPLYVASAEEDRWADPKGEFLSAKLASVVYELYGKKGLSSIEMPAVNSPVMETVGYHIRTGKHGITEYDWINYVKFADMHLKGEIQKK